MSPDNRAGHNLFEARLSIETPSTITECKAAVGSHVLIVDSESNAFNRDWQNGRLNSLTLVSSKESPRLRLSAEESSEVSKSSTLDCDSSPRLTDTGLSSSQSPETPNDLLSSLKAGRL